MLHLSPRDGNRCTQCKVLTVASTYVWELNKLIHQLSFMSGEPAFTLVHRSYEGDTLGNVYMSVKRHIHHTLKTSYKNKVTFVGRDGQPIKSLRVKKDNEIVKPLVRLRGKTPINLVPYLNSVDPHVIRGGPLLDVDQVTDWDLL